MVPAFIGGRNTDLFCRAGRLHAALGTLLLPRELLPERGQAVCVRLGMPLTTPEVHARRGEGAEAATRVFGPVSISVRYCDASH